ncbi:MAG: T9SS type A sorting domain-containing protein [Bacteroidia bacterium]|jgi:hypothetical protein|nr:T9SS type A sorting domain-containing protein [Bacteroidia bacterium]
MRKQLQTIKKLLGRGLALGVFGLGLIAFVNNDALAQGITATTYPISYTTGVTLFTVPGVNTQHVGNSNDDTPGPLTSFGSGFTFTYGGVQYSHLSVSPDGFFRLGTAASAQFTNDLSSTTNTPIIAPYWDDVATGTTGQVRGFITGTAPNRIYVIDWFVTIPRNITGAPNANFQCWLYENGGKIQFVYGTGIISAAMSYSVGHAITTGTPTRISTVTIDGTSFIASTNAYVSATPNNANAAAIPSGSSITYTPSTPSASPNNLTFSSITANGITLNWGDSTTNESFYVVQRSTDGGINYTTLANIAANSTTYNATGLLPGQTYTFKVIAATEGNFDSSVVGSQATLPPVAIISTSIGGNWKDPATWVGGIVPTATDSVIIADGATVTIDTTAGACYALVVGQGISGILEYRAASAATLNVSHSVYINTGAIFNAGTGTLTTHTLTIGGTATAPSPGNLINNGTLDFFGTAGANITFFGSLDGSITGAGTFDFRRITLSKGAVLINRPMLTFNAAFTVEDGTTVGVIATHTAGILQIAGTFTQNSPLYNAAAHTIPLNGGVWLNNPNFTVTAQNGNMTNNGLLRITQGTYNISTVNTAVLNFGAGAHLWVEGGVLNHSARILTASVITFTQSGGIINVATVGNSTSGSASFGLTSIATAINWTGGRVVLNQRNTGATIVDYNVAPLSGYNGGTLQVGSSATATNFDFRINGNTPNLTIDTVTNNKSALLRLQTNVRGKVYIPVGATLNLNGQNLLFLADSFTNNGFVDGRTAASNFVFFGNTAQFYQGLGADTIQAISNQNTAGGVSFLDTVVAYRVNFFSVTPINNSGRIVLGNGIAQAVTVQIGVANFTSTAGIFDVAPTFNLGTGTYSLIYQQEGALRTTGVEIPVSRSITNLTISDTNNVTLAGGNLTLTGTLAMTAGRLNTSDTTLLIINNTAAAASNIGSATSYVNGPMQRRIADSLTTASTYSFPIGRGAVYAPIELVNPKTSLSGEVDVLVRYVDSATTGTPDGVLISTLPNPYYWQISIPNGAANLDSATRVRVTRAGLTGVNRLAYSSTINGIYAGRSGGPVVNVITSDTIVGAAATEGFYTAGEVIIPISGSFLVGATKTAPDYTTITAFLADISGKQVQGNITLNLDSDYDPSLETFPITFNAFATNNAAHTITIKPNAGVQEVISGNNANAILLFNNNARNWIVDGSNNGTSSRDLIIRNDNTGTAAVVRYIGSVANQGVQNSTLRNTIIRGGSNLSSIGVLVGGTTLSVFSNGIGHDNITIQNNQVYNTNHAIAVSGTSAAVRVKKVNILQNALGIDTASLSNRQVSIHFTHADTCLVEGNTIFNMIGSISFGTITGIHLNTNTSNITIRKNTIRNIVNENTSAGGAAGIWVSAAVVGVNNQIVNNSISRVRGTNYNWGNPYSQYTPHGIFIQSGTDLKVYFNSVHLSGAYTSGTAQTNSSALTIATSTISNLDIRNNTFSNSSTSTAAASKFYAVTHWRSTSGQNINNNNYFVSGTQGVLGYDYNPTTFTGVDNTTLSQVQSTLGANVNSVNSDPQFVNDSTLIIGLGTLAGLGTPLAGITTDILDSTRNNPPSIGAYENGVDLSGPTITYTNLTNTFLVTNRVLTDFATITDFNGVDTTANKPRIYYKKTLESNVFGSYPTDNNSTFNGWKYAEAADSTSPFSFTIDYSLLTSPLVVGDSIQYFVVAQDLKTPTSNVGATPSAGFGATSVNTITSAPTTPRTYAISDPPLAGAYLVGSGQVAPNFPSITAAVSALNLRGISAGVEFQLTDSIYSSGSETYPIVINEVTGGSAGNRVIIRPTLPNTRISGNAASIFRLNGTDFFTIDGSITPGGSSKDLTIIDSLTASTVINFVSLGAGQGCRFDSIINTRLFGPTSGTVSSVIHIGASGFDVAGFDNSDIVIQNNNIASGYKGITSFGNAAGKTKRLTISNNIIGSPTSRITWRGIELQQTDSSSIDGNRLEHIISSNTNIKVIFLNTGSSNITVSRNIIDTCVYSGTGGWGVIGIHANPGAGAANITMTNNMIGRLYSDGYFPITSTDVLLGVRLESGSAYSLYHNTINLSGSYAGVSGATYCAGLHVASGVSGGVDVRNNIFINSFVNTNGTLGTSSYAIASSAPNTVFSNINYNNYYVAGTQGILGFLGADQTSLGAMVSSFGGNANSINDSIEFISSSDLHLGGTSIGDTILRSLLLPSVPTDIDNESRNIVFTYMGADENIGTPVPVKLTQFTATESGKNAWLSWTTVSETNNRGFQVERAFDGRSFEKIGFVQGAGNSTTPKRYSLTDTDVFTKTTVAYYRLRQIDFDGKFEFSQIVRVNSASENLKAISVSPNPFADNFNISVVATQNGDVSIELVDIQGRVVATSSAVVVEGANTLAVKEGANLKAGIYFARIYMNGETQVVKLVKE